MMTRRTIQVAVLAALLTGAANPPPGAAIAARQAGFKRMGAAMKLLNDQLRGGSPDRVAVAAAARTIAALAREQPKLFPAGSGPGGGVTTDAKAEIWSQRPAFDAMMAKMIGESGRLAQIAAGGDTAAIAAQVKATGATCSACHRQFRVDD